MIHANLKSRVDISDNCIIEHDSRVEAANGCISIGKKFILRESSRISATRKGSISIGERCTTGSRAQIVASQNNIMIKNDCMMSFDVVLWAGNIHNAYNLDKRVNSENSKKDIFIDEHVWIGFRATLLKGTKIGKGSIIGASALVNKEFPENNCCIAGNPARAAKDHVAWIRVKEPIFSDYEHFEEFDYTDETDES